MAAMCIASHQALVLSASRAVCAMPVALTCATPCPISTMQLWLIKGYRQLIVWYCSNSNLPRLISRQDRHKTVIVNTERKQHHKLLASYPGPASQSWGKRAWYQPTRACANFSQIFGKPYTYGSFTCYTDVSSSNVRLFIDSVSQWLM